VKQNNVFNAPNNFAPAPRSMSTGFPDPVFVQIPSNGLVDASPAVLRNAGYFHVKPDMHEGSLHSFNVAFQRELPGRFSLDVRMSETGATTSRRSTTKTRRRSSGCRATTAGRCSCRSGNQRT